MKEINLIDYFYFLKRGIFIKYLVNFNNRRKTYFFYKGRKYITNFNHYFLRLFLGKIGIFQLFHLSISLSGYLIIPTILPSKKPSKSSKLSLKINLKKKVCFQNSKQNSLTFFFATISASEVPLNRIILGQKKSIKHYNSYLLQPNILKNQRFWDVP